MTLSKILLNPEPPPGLWLLCGPPASGKSTFREHWWAGPVVSPDDLRASMLGVDYDPKREALVWLRATQQAVRLLKAGKGMLIDATNVSRATRRRWVRLARERGTHAYAIVCWDPQRLPLTELLARNAARARVVPPDKLEEYAANWEPPSTAEGLAEVWTVVGGVP